MKMIKRLLEALNEEYAIISMNVTWISLCLERNGRR
nr:MAG TPA: hypothetical protein [Caudoviricetes sp.]